MINASIARKNTNDYKQEQARLKAERIAAWADNRASGVIEKESKRGQSFVSLASPDKELECTVDEVLEVLKANGYEVKVDVYGGTKCITVRW